MQQLLDIDISLYHFYMNLIIKLLYIIIIYVNMQDKY